MKSLLYFFSKINSKLKVLLKVICAFFMASITIIVLWGVVARYFLGSQPAFTEEIARMFLIELTFFGAALAFAEKSHIGLDYLSEKFSISAKKLCSIIASCITIFFVMAFLVYGGIELVLTSLKSSNNLVSVNVGVWTVYVCVPMAGVFAIMFLIEAFLKTLISDERK